MGDTEQFYDKNTQRYETRKTTSAGDVADAQAASKMGGFDNSQVKPQVDYSGTSSKTPKPKREDYDSGLGGQGKYSMALRKWQGEQAAETNKGKEQRQALSGN